jgi:hypothetical protein
MDVTDKIIPHLINQAILVLPNKQAQYVKSCWCTFYKILQSDPHNIKFVVIKDDLKICFNPSLKNDYNNHINDILRKYNKLYGNCFDIFGAVIIYSLERDLNIDDVNKL